MKIFIGVIIVGISTCIGILLGLKYTERKKFFKDFTAFNNRYLSGVAFTGDSIKKILSFSAEKNSDFYECIITFFYEKKFALKKRYLSRDESDFLFNYLSGLGRGDAESEKKNATFTESKLKDYVEKCEEEEKKYKPLLVKLGFLLGVVVFILII